MNRPVIFFLSIDVKMQEIYRPLSTAQKKMLIKFLRNIFLLGKIIFNIV